MAKVFCPKCEADVFGTKFQTNFASEDRIRYSKIRCLSCSHEFVNKEELHSKSVKEFNLKGLANKLQYKFNGKRRAIQLGKRASKGMKKKQGESGKEGNKTKGPPKKASIRRPPQSDKGS